MSDLIMKFTQPNIDAIRDGRKTMTRRPVKPQPEKGFGGGTPILSSDGMFLWPHGVVSNWMTQRRLKYNPGDVVCVADPDGIETDLLIRITGVRAERLQDITLSDCAAEGAPPTHEADAIWDDTSTFQAMWRRIYGPTNQFAWERNPFVFVYEFEAVKETA